MKLTLLHVKGTFIFDATFDQKQNAERLGDYAADSRPLLD